MSVCRPAGTSLLWSVFYQKTGCFTYLSLLLVITQKPWHTHNCPSSPDLWYLIHNKSSSVRRTTFTELQINTKSIHSDLVFSTMWLLIFLVWLIIWAGGTYWYLFGKRRPFSLQSVRPPGPRVFDQKERDKVIKQGKMINITIMVNVKQRVW